MKFIISVLLASTFVLTLCNGVGVNGPENNRYFVSVTGSDRNPGTFERPFKTIQQGCSILKPGDTLYIRGGEYQEKIIIRRSGTEKGDIKIQPYEKERVVLNGEGVKDKSNLIYANNKSYFCINGLELCNSREGDTPTGILIEGHGQGIQILNNKIYNVKSEDNAHGIAAYGTNGIKSIKDLTIEGNEVYDCILGSSEAVVVNGNVERFMIKDNVIHHNDNIGIDCIGFENTAPKNDQARNGAVVGNKVYNISSADNPAYNGDACAGGIYVDGGRDIQIEKNIVYNCDIGIEVACEQRNQAAKNIIVRNNLIYSSGLYGCSIGGASKENGYAAECQFSNNTLYNNHVGINIQKSNGNKIFNNVIYETKTLIEGEIRANHLAYNIWYSPKGNPQKLNGFSDPKLKDPKNLEFGLTPDSPAIDAGDPAFRPDEMETDLLNNPRIRGKAVDCGAFEYRK
ncbi:MAG: right-handed parallel beta-helix repeat-containing protein [Eubacteriales bacterium]|nr:right-handed parallel beta-helix repeat-containing protein [Eubacteriales bacterium]